MEQTLAYIAFFATLVFTILLFWVEFFRKRPSLTKLIEFKAPEGLTSAAVGYVTDGAVDTRDVMSLIPWFAGKGYLKIESRMMDETASDGVTTNMQLRKLRDLPDDAYNYEKMLFYAMFPGKETVFNITYKYDKSFAASWLSTKESVEHAHSKNMYEFFKPGIWLMALVVVSFCLTLGLTSRTETGESCWGCIIVPLIFMAAAFEVVYLISGHSMGEAMGTQFKMWLMPIGAIAVSAMGVYVSIDYGNTSFVPVGWMWGLFLLISLSSLFTTKMLRPTKQRIQQLGLLLGLKEYIKTAEKNELQQLATNNTAQFYIFLSYALAFGLAPTWEKKFRGLNMMVYGQGK